MSPALTRAQRRRMTALGAKVDLVTQSDRKFFLRGRERQHCVRISHPAEIEQLRIVSGKPLAAPAGCRHFTVVRNIAPGLRWRLFVLNVADAETDLPEEVAREVWEAAETTCGSS